MKTIVMTNDIGPYGAGPISNSALLRRIVSGRENPDPQPEAAPAHVERFPALARGPPQSERLGGVAAKWETASADGSKAARHA
jgi:hypothetical protein